MNMGLNDVIFYDSKAICCESELGVKKFTPFFEIVRFNYYC